MHRPYEIGMFFRVFTIYKKAGFYLKLSEDTEYFRGIFRDRTVIECQGNAL